MRQVNLLRHFLLWGLALFLLFLVRVLVDAIVLEPHYFWALRGGFLKAPLLFFGIPLTLWSDIAAALLLELGARHGSRGPLSPPLFAVGLCLVFAHLGQGDPLKLPLIIPVAWAVSSAAGVFGVWTLLQGLKSETAMQPLAETGS